MTADERADLTSTLTKRSRPSTFAGPDFPARLVSLIGREVELANVAALLRCFVIRLVTLTCPGGVGKTSLALRVASELKSDYADGIALVELASIRDPSLVAAAIAHAIGVDESSASTTVDRIADFLRSRRMLLLIDNFEHLLSAAPIVTELLSRSKGLTVIATSRGALRISGEHDIPVEPLAVPDINISDPIRIAATSSIQLFVHRASAVDATFKMMPENIFTIAEICRRLDGIPLAIELAAARSRVFSPDAFLARMDRRLPLLNDGRRDVAHRHQTMRNAIAWSYDLLSPSEQCLFRRLSVLAGDFDLSAAEAITTPWTDFDPGTPLLECEILDGISTLVDQRLLYRVESVDGEPRFSMLETIREFAEERLAASGEVGAARDAHAARCLTFLDEAAKHWFARGQTTWATRIETNLDNFRALFSRAVESKDGALANKLAGQLWPFWIVRGHIREGRQWTQYALDLDHDTLTLDHVRTLTGAARFARYFGEDCSARVLGEQALHLAEQICAATGIESAHLLIGLALTAVNQRDYVRAVELNEQALAILLPLKSVDSRAADFECLSLVYLANIHVAIGDDDRAKRLAVSALEHARQMQWEWGESEVICCLAPLEYRRRNFADAARLCLRGLQLSWQQRDPWPLIMLIEFSGIVAGATGQMDSGARLIGAADHLAASLGLPVGSVQYCSREQGLDSIKLSLGEEQFNLRMEEGRTTHFDEACAQAMSFLEESQRFSADVSSWSEA